MWGVYEPIVMYVCIRDRERGNWSRIYVCVWMYIRMCPERVCVHVCVCAHTVRERGREREIERQYNGTLLDC